MERSDMFILGAAFVSFLFSISLWFGAWGGDADFNKQAGIFVGLWVPSIIAVGSYFRRRATA
ncbi:MAG: hypothetical protein DWQ47_11545 [Acidobacteria bacterium]|nr:MAG: hypothetical protein DWQ32_13960 [Acidobacteriota bacterium]REJ98209.1 MAG: hypothetical protein DWQ38_16760 [Acidobacteriota bacterium]REK16953.1 MAG: hypothetical protein DWQ43_01805 [Acidobacteriota bacterium]REK42863.1 MAG: hypothetical protein DWQ47_11545 [Acidobacteriota bacterium]